MTCSVLSPVALSLALVAFASCGSNRQLQSITVTPATADAQSFPNGQVPFAATGVYRKPPSPQQLSGNTVTWCVGDSSGSGKCAGNIAIGVSINQDGLAQCNPGFTGTETVLAGTQPVSMNPDAGSQLKILGSAQLTCP